MWTAEVIAIVCATFLFAGWVKGVVGLGLPTISLALLAATVGLREAIALMLVPSMVTNLWQGLAGGAFVALLRRLWLLLLAACLGTWFGVGVLAPSSRCCDGCGYCFWPPASVPGSVSGSWPSPIRCC
jgi:uncharacterized membrane protein